MSFRARDLLLWPTLISALRLPLAALFPFALQRPAAALAVLLAAGASDVLDGWVARRLGQETAIGSIADGISDKLFILTVALALVWSGRLSCSALLLLGVRDLGEAALVVWLLLRRGLGQNSEQRADVWGKATTFLQFATAAGAVLSLPYLVLPAAAAGVCGAVEAVRGARRLAAELRAKS